MRMPYEMNRGGETIEEESSGEIMRAAGALNVVAETATKRDKKVHQITVSPFSDRL